MKRMVVAIAFVISVTTTLVLMPAPALALPCCDTSYTFFSDCTFTDVIGEDGIDCNGHRHTWGTVNYSGPYYYEAGSCGRPSCGPDPTCVGGGYWGC